LRRRQMESSTKKKSGVVVEKFGTTKAAWSRIWYRYKQEEPWGAYADSDRNRRKWAAWGGRGGKKLREKT